MQPGMTRGHSAAACLDSGLMGTWSADVARYLLGPACPRCYRAPVSGTVCLFCQAELTGPVADELRAVSERAAALLQERQSLVDRLPTAAPVALPTVAAPAVLPPPSGAPRSTTPPPTTAPRASSQISVQSVLAVAGAGLVALGAFVFTYLNADFTSVAARNTVIGVITVLFLGLAWVLSRRGIRFSAEAIGALGMAFVALDISAFVEVAPEGGDWAFGALGTLVSSVVMLAVGILTRIRSWFWLSLLGISITPAIFSAGFDEPWAPVIGTLAVGIVALGVHESIRWLTARFDSELRAERALATVLRLAVVVVVAALLVRIDEPWATTRALGSAAAIAVLALIAGLGSRHLLSRLWSYLAGGFGVLAVALLPFALDLPDGERHGYLALVPAAAAVAAILIALVPVPRALRLPAWPAGALTVALAAVVPAGVVAVGQGAFSALRTMLVRGSSGPDAVPDPWQVPDLVAFGREVGPSVILGLAAAGLGLAVLSWGIRRAAARRTAYEDAPAGSALPSAVLALAIWLGALSLSAIATWTALPWAGYLIGALALSALFVLAILLIPAIRGALLRYRVPLLVGAHVMIVISAFNAWSLDTLTVLGGVGAVAAILLLSRALPAPVRALYIGIANAYGLIVFARALDLAGLETIVVLCLTTTLAGLMALAATLVRPVPRSWWYAILIVTIVPFVIGVISVINPENRSGWTALSTGVIAALAVTLVITRRVGLTTLVRAMAAAVVLPAISVVVVSLTSEFLEASGSPVALPIIATIVACVLATGRLYRGGLAASGLAERAVRVVGITLEVSAFVTAAIAVLLALVLPASGYDVATLVLLLLGIGAAAARLFAGRRYGWWLAAASWTGALWCVWALAGVAVVEPYVLPPAVAAIVVGTVLTARGRDGMPLVATGLAAAVAPTLVILAAAGNGEGAVLPWRALAMLAASLVLLAIGLLVTRRPGATVPRLGALRIPVLVVAIGAAAGGAIQAVRIGLDVDPGGFATPVQQMLPVLAYSLAATALAAAAGLLLRAGSRWRIADAPGASSRWASTRWLLAPAVAYLVVGPISARGFEDLPMWTLWALALLVLVVMVLTVLFRETWLGALPPVWFLFGAAWCTAFAGWSTRELNVEWYSLPLGLTLLACGVLALLRPVDVPRQSLNSWPAGFRGSWPLLAPGLIATLLASVMATGTNPAIWRAIVVIGLALIAILLGSLFRLAAPFIIGLIVLPVENIIVFAALLSRNDGALPWWITLAVVGAVLLAIAVNSERRTASSGGFGARLRDLK
jgi:hypothetical protein